MRKKKTDGILYIDGFNWSALKKSDKELKQMNEAERTARKTAEAKTFDGYRSQLRLWIQGQGGQIWKIIGDCVIACNFPSIDHAVATAIAIQRELSSFNLYGNRLERPLWVRIGVSRGNLPDIDESKRGEADIPELDEAGHLQKICPHGRVRISGAAFDALRFGRQGFRPGLASGLKAKSAGSFVSIDRMITTHEWKFMERLPPRQRRCYPVIVVSADDYFQRLRSHSFLDIHSVLKKAFIIVGETRKEEASPGSVSHPASTSDAVGIMELFAALQAAPEVTAGVDEWVDSGDVATLTNLVVVGSPAVNVFAYAFNTILPVGFTQDGAAPIRIRVDEIQHTTYYPSDFEHSEFDRHYALVYLTRSPVNPRNDLLWIAGISGMATQAAARFVRDLVLNPTSAVDRGKLKKGANVAIIQPLWQTDYKPEDYQGFWRVSDYKVAWSGRR